MSSSLAAAYDISPLLTPPLCRQRQIAVKVSQQLAPVCRAPLRGPTAGRGPVLAWTARLKLISLFPKMFPDYALGLILVEVGLRRRNCK